MSTIPQRLAKIDPHSADRFGPGRQDLLILGASARAAAQSARRAGLVPIASDLFADADLRACCQAVRCGDYPQGLATIAEAAPLCPWLATGGLENYPDLVDHISRHRPLAGNRGDVLRRVRDPFLLSEELKQADIPSPAISRVATDIPVDGSWLQKPFASCGGTNIRPWTPQAASPNDATTAKNNHNRFYFQQRIEGLPVSAVYLAANGKAQFLGATRQLVGTRWTGACGFQYAGSIGPLLTDDALKTEWTRLGERLAYSFDLTGLFGVDAILAGETVWPIEVNPRLPASVEILERAWGFSAVGQHLDACQSGLLPEVPLDATDEVTGPVVHGKAVLYSEHDRIIDKQFVYRIEQHNHQQQHPVIADIPILGTTIRAGHPLLTVFAESLSHQIVEQRLRDLATKILAK